MKATTSTMLVSGILPADTTPRSTQSHTPAQARKNPGPSVRGKGVILRARARRLSVNGDTSAAGWEAKQKCRPPWMRGAQGTRPSTRKKKIESKPAVRLLFRDPHAAKDYACRQYFHRPFRPQFGLSPSTDRHPTIEYHRPASAANVPAAHYKSPNRKCSGQTELFD
jgi:hypothetical protein